MTDQVIFKTPYIDTASKHLKAKTYPMERFGIDQNICNVQNIDYIIKQIIQ
jgi:hypothetical protein